MSTATAEPIVKKSLADLPPLQPLDKAFGDALKAQEPQAESAKPEVKKPEAKPAAEKPKAEPEKPTEPAKPEKPAKKKSALDATLSEETPVEAKPELDEVQQLLDAPNPDWPKAKETIKRQGRELKEAIEKLSKASEAPPELAQKLKTQDSELTKLREDNAKLRDSILAIDVRYDPATQEKIAGRDKQATNLADRVAEAGGNKEAFLAAMDLPLAKRGKAIDAALEGIQSQRELTTINTKLAQIELVDEQLDEQLSKPHQSFEQMKKHREIESKKHEETVQQFKAVTFEKIAKQLQKESPLFRPAPAESEGADEFNADLKADMERAIELTGQVSPEDATIAAYKARRFDTITKYMMKEGKAKDARISELEETLAKFEGSEPGYRGGKKPAGLAPHEVPLEKAFFDALQSQAPV